MYERIINLIGMDNFKKINNCKVLLVGCGGVGSFAFTALIRSGFLNITVIDKDQVELSNLNRQLVASLDTIGKSKVEIALNMAKNLNKDIKIKAINTYLSSDNINILDKDYDYIIDACDTLKTKVELIKWAEENNIKIITSLGMGNRINASKIKITTLAKTAGDPLAKVLRKLVKEHHLKDNIKVCFSEELPIKKGKVDSLITSPGIAGLLIVNEIINDIVKLS